MDNPAALQVRSRMIPTCDNSFFVQLRYLQTLNSISAENNSTIVFPVPVDVLNTFMGSNNNQRPKVNFVFISQAEKV